jgi:hypothetical protein
MIIPSADMPYPYQRRAAVIKAMERDWSHENCSDLGEIVICNIDTCRNADEAYLLGYWAGIQCERHKLSNEW